MKTVVVNPTYNEAENIERLIREVQEIAHLVAGSSALHSPSEKVGKGSGYDLHQLIVDDNSPDQTAQIVKRLQKKYPKLHLITGPRKGLGAAYVRGFKHAMSEMKADILVQMDADFSHDPRDLPRLLREMEAGNDVVIGSRYVEGGSVDPNWGWFRKLNSFGASVFARFVAGLYNVHDITTGYRAIRVKNVAEKVNWDRIFARGYSFQLMALYRLLQHTDKVKEIPIQFIDRKFGVSKVGANATYFRDVAEFIRNAWLIRAKKTETLLKFLTVGTVGFAVNAALWRALLAAFPLGLGAAQLLAGEAAIISNFTFNSLWTFRDRDTKRGLISQFLQYNVTAYVSVIISAVVVEVLGYLFGTAPRLRYLFIGVVVATAWNFLISNYWIFKEKD